MGQPAVMSAIAELFHEVAPPTCANAYQPVHRSVAAVPASSHDRPTWVQADSAATMEDRGQPIDWGGLSRRLIDTVSAGRGEPRTPRAYFGTLWVIT